MSDVGGLVTAGAVYALYGASLVVIVASSAWRSGVMELSKALSTVGSLAVLAGVGSVRILLSGGLPEGGTLIGLRLNLCILVGTRLDPMNAVVWFPGEHSRKRRVRHVGPKRRRESSTYVRYKSAAVPRLLFFPTAVAVYLLGPSEWFP